METLYKTTIIIWTAYDPRNVDMETLSIECTNGNAYCSLIVSEKIASPEKDKDWDGSEFFNSPE